MIHTTRKQQIVDQASVLFKEKGYSAVTMRDLAEALDMKAASLYNHIASKHEILSDLILSIARNFTSGMETIKKSDSTAFEKAELLISLHVDISIRYTSSLATMNNDWMHLEGTSFNEYINMRRNYEKDFRSILISGVEQGDFMAFDTEIMLFNLLSTLRTLHLWIPKKTEGELQILTTELPKMLLSGIKKSPLSST